MDILNFASAIASEVESLESRATDAEAERDRLREALEIARALIEVGEFGDVDIPANWPSVGCENAGHRERHKGDWRCPDCASQWWSLYPDEENDEFSGQSYQLEAFLFRTLAAARSALNTGTDG